MWERLWVCGEEIIVQGRIQDFRGGGGGSNFVHYKTRGGGGCKGGGISYAMGGAVAAAPAPKAGADRQGGGGPSRNTSLVSRQIRARRGFPHLDVKINFGRGGGVSGQRCVGGRGYCVWGGKRLLCVGEDVIVCVGGKSWLLCVWGKRLLYGGEEVTVCGVRGYCVWVG